MALSLDPLRELPSKGNNLNCRQGLTHRDVNWGIVYNFEKPRSNQISSDGGIKQIVENLYNKGLYNH